MKNKERGKEEKRVQEFPERCRNVEKTEVKDMKNEGRENQ